MSPTLVASGKSPTGKWNCSRLLPLTASPEGPFAQPNSIAVDKRGTIYLAERSQEYHLLAAQIGERARREGRSELFSVGPMT